MTHHRIHDSSHQALAMHLDNFTESIKTITINIDVILLENSTENLFYS